MLSFTLTPAARFLLINALCVVPLGIRRVPALAASHMSEPLQFELQQPSEAQIKSSQPTESVSSFSETMTRNLSESYYQALAYIHLSQTSAQQGDRNAANRYLIQASDSFQQISQWTLRLRLLPKLANAHLSTDEPVVSALFLREALDIIETETFVLDSEETQGLSVRRVVNVNLEQVLIEIAQVYRFAELSMSTLNKY